MDTTIVNILQEFLKTGYKAAKVDGLRDILQKVARDNNLPIEVFERRNVIYMMRTDDA